MTRYRLMSTPGFWTHLFSPEGFMQRRLCGMWSPGLIFLHNASDFLIWTAYLAIPVILLRFTYQRRRSLPFPQVFWLFALFILSCGTTHLMEIVMFYWPIYRFAGLVKLVTAAASWATVIALIPIVPRALAMRSPEDLEREIVDRKKAEEEVRRLNSELEDRVRERTAELDAASRAKDEFLMTLSHELRTPLNAIQGWASLLTSDQLDPATQRQALATIERNAWAQARLVDDILEVSRIITGKVVVEPRPCDFRAVVEEALSTIAPAATAKKIQVLTDFSGAGVMVNGDAARLRQVVWNLLSNAVKFTRTGGTITVSLKDQGSHLEFTVADTGEGIEPEFLPHVFDRFRQADSSTTRRHGGLGLGLAIVRHLVELHGGTVAAASPGVGQGAVFTVHLPRLVPPIQVNAESADEFEADAGPTPGTSGVLVGKRVLVVDDEAEARQLITTILALNGAEVRSAESAPAAWERLCSWHPDVLVSDIGMPVESGLDLIARVRSAGGGTGAVPALALTAYASQDDRARALAAGFDGHLPKPVAPADLLEIVARLARRGP